MGPLRFGIALALLPAAPLAASSPTVPGAPAASPAEIMELRGPLPPSGLPPFALTCLLLSGLLALVLAWLWLHRTRPIPAPPSENPEDPVETLGRLSAWYQRGDAPAGLLCTRVAALVRTTLASRTGLPAPRLTTGEFLGQAGAPALLDARELALTDQLLSFCDGVKFAAHDPDAAELQWLLDATGELLGRGVEERT